MMSVWKSLQELRRDAAPVFVSTHQAFKLWRKCVGEKQKAKLCKMGCRWPACPRQAERGSPAWWKGGGGGFDWVPKKAATTASGSSRTAEEEEQMRQWGAKEKWEATFSNPHCLRPAPPHRSPPHTHSQTPVPPPLPNTQSLSGQTHDELPCQQNSFRDQLIQQKWTRAISRWKTQCKESKVAPLQQTRKRRSARQREGERGERCRDERASKRQRGREGERAVVEVSLTEIGHLML